VITLSVVVPATDSPRTLARVVAAIDAAADGPDELIVVDAPIALSASGARNAGVARAVGDVVVFVDADVEVHPDVFTRLRATFDDDPTLDAVFGSYDDAPADRSVVSAFRNLLHHHVHQTSAGPAETFWTGLGAVRRTTFLAAGGFDEERFPLPSVEDIDLGRRLHAGGGRTVLDPAIQGTHLKVWTLRSMLWTDFARRGVPWVAMQVRHRQVTSALNLGWRHRLSASSCALFTTAALLQAPLVALSALLALVGLNHQLYGLLARRQGVLHAVAGVGLHGLHHLVSIAAVPVGLAAVACGQVRSRSARVDARRAVAS
jgi:hypothetical protein